jgi:hypothetical protein
MTIRNPRRSLSPTSQSNFQPFASGFRTQVIFPGRILVRCSLAGWLFAALWSADACASHFSGLETNHCPVQIETNAVEEPNGNESELAAVVLEAFRQTHRGYSSDEVILNDSLNVAFIDRCRKQLPNAAPVQLNRKLLNLRKAGNLKNIPTTKHPEIDTTSVEHVAEIVTRSIHDRFQVTTDQIMTDPNLRSEFDAMSAKIDPKIDRYAVRRAAFALRKTRRLRPELIVRVADWNRVISELSVEQVRSDFSRVPESPGVYIFRDRSGYLYIGQSENLRKRIRIHLDQENPGALGRYIAERGESVVTIELHAFPADSPAKKTMVRRAYESELIRSRKPRFNIMP